MANGYIDWTSKENQALLNGMEGRDNSKPAVAATSALSNYGDVGATDVFGQRNTNSQLADYAAKGSMNNQYMMDQGQLPMIPQNATVGAAQVGPYGSSVQASSQMPSIFNNGGQGTLPGTNMIDPNNTNASRKLSAVQDSQIGLNNAIAENMGSSWSDWANIGIGGVGALMDMGLYGGRKDRLEAGNDALNQNMAIQQKEHDNRTAQQQNLGTTFSNNP